MIDGKLATIPRFYAGRFRPTRVGERGRNQHGLTHSVSGALTKLRGAHNLKLGWTSGCTGPLGALSVLGVAVLHLANSYTRGPLDNSTAAPIGQELAAALMGYRRGRCRERQFGHAGPVCGAVPARRLQSQLAADAEPGAALRAGIALDGALRPLVADSPTSRRTRSRRRCGPTTRGWRSRDCGLDVPGAGRADVSEPGRLGRVRFWGEEQLMPRIGVAYQLRRTTTLRAATGSTTTRWSETRRWPRRRAFAEHAHPGVAGQRLTYVRRMPIRFPTG